MGRAAQPEPTERSYLVGPALAPVAASSWVDVLVRAAEEEGSRPLASFMRGREIGETYSFVDVLDGACRYAAHLRALDLKPGDPVILSLPMSAEFVYAFFGVQLAGGVPVPFREPPPPREGQLDEQLLGLALVTSDCAARFILVLPEAADRVRYLPLVAEGSCAVVSAGDMGSTRLERSAWATPASTDPALLQYTSGPVLEPLGAVLSHGSVLANVHAVGVALGTSRDTVTLSWLPAYQDMGLIGVLLSTLYWRCRGTYMRPESFLLSPAKWLQLMSELRVTMAAGPNFGYQSCVRRIRDRHLEGVDLSAWRCALSGAETIQPSTVEAFEERFAGVGLRRGLTVAAYGLAENCLVSTLGDPNTAACQTQTVSLDALQTRRQAVAPVEGEQELRLVSLGSPIAGQEVAVVDPDGGVLPTTHVGEIVVRGASLMSGYYQREDATRRKVRDGWLHTGDEGYISGGCLYITGRLKRMVIKTGRNTYCDDIERVAAESLGISVDQVCACAVANERSGSEDLVLDISTPAPIRCDEADLRNIVDSALLALLGLRAAEIRFSPDA